MLVFFGIANIFLGFLTLDVVNGNPNHTQYLKIAYGIVVGIMIMAYMLFQPNTATFKVHSPYFVFYSSQTCQISPRFCSEVQQQLNGTHL
jgi:hypothetical protein